MKIKEALFTIIAFLVAGCFLLSCAGKNKAGQTAVAYL